MITNQIRLPIDLTEKYLERLPLSIRESQFEEDVRKSVNLSEDDKLQMIAANYSTQIMKMRQSDLKHYKHLLEEEIPQDYILEEARDILVNTGLDSANFDYDDPMIGDLQDTLDILDCVSTMLKAERKIKKEKSRWAKPVPINNSKWPEKEREKMK